MQQACNMQHATCMHHACTMHATCMHCCVHDTCNIQELAGLAPRVHNDYLMNDGHFAQSSAKNNTATADNTIIKACTAHTTIAPTTPAILPIAPTTTGHTTIAPNTHAARVRYTSHEGQQRYERQQGQQRPHGRVTDRSTSAFRKSETRTTEYKDAGH